MNKKLLFILTCALIAIPQVAYAFQPGINYAFGWGLMVLVPLLIVYVLVAGGISIVVKCLDKISKKRKKGIMMLLWCYIPVAILATIILSEAIFEYGFFELLSWFPGEHVCDFILDLY